MGTAWNPNSYPVDGLLIKNIPVTFRQIEQALEDINNLEHTTLAGDYGVGDSTYTGGVHKNGSAVGYEGTSAPSNRPDAATALADNAYDRGRLWLDDNYDPPVLKRWDGSAWEVLGRYLFDAASLELILHNGVEEDADGGRESLIRFKGEQSGGELSTLAIIEASHDGASDDQKGQLVIKVNDGDDNDAPSLTALAIDAAAAVTLGGALAITGATTFNGSVNMNSQTITNVPDASASGHPVHWGQFTDVSSRDNDVASLVITNATFKIRVFDATIVGNAVSDTTDIAHGLTRCFGAVSQVKTIVGSEGLDTYSIKVESIDNTNITFRNTNAFNVNVKVIAVGR
jgi:hypothetical protein